VVSGLAFVAQAQALSSIVQLSLESRILSPNGGLCSLRRLLLSVRLLSRSTAVLVLPSNVGRPGGHCPVHVVVVLLEIVPGLLSAALGQRLEALNGGHMAGWLHRLLIVARSRLQGLLHVLSRASLELLLLLPGHRLSLLLVLHVLLVWVLHLRMKTVCCWFGMWLES